MWFKISIYIFQNITIRKYPTRKLYNMGLNMDPY